MILQELVLHNYGVYRGRQSFNLEPTSADKPIILIGAFNGSGKTTILSALNLVLYGKRALDPSQRRRGYERYLSGAINREVSPGEGSAIELTFRRAASGEEKSYTVYRAWTARESGAIKEHFEVRVDNEVDSFLSEQWQDHVEHILPQQIMPLFFFDGEKIEDLADVQTSSALLETALNGLLGLDLVERLTTDLKVYERRKRSEISDDEFSDEMQQNLDDLDEAKHLRGQVLDRVAGINNRKDRASSDLESAQEKFKSKGGELYAKRADLTEELSNAKAAFNVHVETILNPLACEAAPLLMVKSLVQEVRDQASREIAADEAQTVVSALVDRDQMVLHAIADLGVNGDEQKAIEQLLQEDRFVRIEESKTQRYLALGPDENKALAYLQTAGFEELDTKIDDALNQSERLEAEIDDLERHVASIPHVETLKPTLDKIEKLEHLIVKLDVEQKVIEEEERAAGWRVTEAERALKRTLTKGIQRKLFSEDTQRCVRHSGQARETLSEFKEKVLKHHLQKLETLILEYFNRINRKSELIAAISIDPKTFTMRLRTGDWKSITPDYLSAGERQILAVATLWALSTASGKEMPTVIDTPLGRLDSQHRTRLVREYFPHAGDQVILLSTDEEIAGDYLEALKPSISRSYVVNYEHEFGGSRVTEGYVV